MVDDRLIVQHRLIDHLRNADPVFQVFGLFDERLHLLPELVHLSLGLVVHGGHCVPAYPSFIFRPYHRTACHVRVGQQAGRFRDFILINGIDKRLIRFIGNLYFLLIFLDIFLMVTKKLAVI